MKILLTGASGQLGQELRPRLAALGSVLAVDRDPGTKGQPGNFRLDLSDAGQLEVFLNRHEPDLVVNTAAWTAVDQAEREPEQAFAVNATAPGCIARWARRNDKALLHFSTDYVFDGSATTPCNEQQPTAPLNVYGESKLAGESAVRESGCRHVILRSSWIYSAHGNNFVLKMLELARSRPSLSIVGDQVGCPTWARNLADYSMRAIERGLTGRRRLPASLYHACDGDVCSWYDFALHVFAAAHKLGLLARLPEVHEVDSNTFQQLARRPRYSAMDTSALRQDLRLETAGLQASLEQCLVELVT